MGNRTEPRLRNFSPRKGGIGPLMGAEHHILQSGRYRRHIFFAELLILIIITLQSLLLDGKLTPR